MKAKILIVDDEKILTTVLKNLLTREGYEVAIAENGETALRFLKNEPLDVVLLDLRLPDANGLDLLPKIRELAPEAGVIIITAYAEIRSAVSAIKEGAFDYLAKPFEDEELLLTIERFLQFKNLMKEVGTLRRRLKQDDALTKFVGESKAVQDILSNIEVVAETDLPVLILGESGCGKELVAQIIHELSPRNKGPFIKINCTAIPETLFEAELFGYERGAFTGAYTSKIGKLELAQGGTILFDEIGDLPLSLQPKLLRVTEEKTFYPLGSNKERRADVRFLFATSKDLKSLMKESLFRCDLYYRISAFTITIPPLRDRKEDIPILIQHFLHLFSQKYNKEIPIISELAYLALLNYDYPGNVRELKHILERAFLLSKDRRIEIWHLPEEVRFTSSVPDNILSSQEISQKKDYKKNLELIEKELILRALKECGGKIGETAKKLGISRKTLWKKLKKYSLSSKV